MLTSSVAATSGALAAPHSLLSFRTLARNWQRHTIAFSLARSLPPLSLALHKFPADKHHHGSSSNHPSTPRSSRLPVPGLSQAGLCCDRVIFHRSTEPQIVHHLQGSDQTLAQRPRHTPDNPDLCLHPLFSSVSEGFFSVPTNHNISNTIVDVCKISNFQSP